jgi:hypothetical protein
MRAAAELGELLHFSAWPTSMMWRYEDDVEAVLLNLALATVPHVMLTHLDSVTLYS